MEKKYPNQLVIIGIHSPKFESEKDPASIRKALARYERNHPVINDADLKMWKAYNVQSWPTMFLIDPEGRLVGRIAEERVYDEIDKAIGSRIKVFRQRGTLNEKPLRLTAANAVERGEGPLFFPGKIVADDTSERLFIADSTHHRVIITDLDGKKIAIAGAGRPGKLDGPFDKATFNDPQGMALAGNILYVADRKNHSIRALDLKARTVKTVAGTGFQNRDTRMGGPALKTGLNSPWDLLFVNKTLFIAMAGSHQIWTYDAAKQRVAPYAGNGFENIADGPLGNSRFAQPSGLTTDGMSLYVADSEVSAIRQVPLESNGLVKTVVGMGLFEFGDSDGVGPQVRLQHALGVVFVDGKLYVADTYNNKIKIIDPAKLQCLTFLGNKTDGTFNEPGGITHAYGKLYVADTNAHRIRVVDLKTKTVSTLELSGVTAPVGIGAETRRNAPSR